MLDYLIFNKLKWFNADTSKDNTVINGKNYFAVPKSFTIPAGTHINWNNDDDGENGYTVYRDANVTCVGAGEKYYFCAGTFVYKYNGDTVGFSGPTDNAENWNHTFYVNKSVVKNVIWGGKAPL